MYFFSSIVSYGKKKKDVQNKIFSQESKKRVVEMHIFLSFKIKNNWEKQNIKHIQE